MKTFLILALTALTFNYASAQSAAIEGNWGAVQQVNGFTFDVTFAISKSSVTLTNVCTGAGTTSTAQISVSSSYTDSTLSFLEAKQDVRSNGPLNCNVQMQVDTFNYTIQANSLIFTHVGSPQTLVLQRK